MLRFVSVVDEYLTRFISLCGNRRNDIRPLLLGRVVILTGSHFERLDPFRVGIYFARSDGVRDYTALESRFKKDLTRKRVGSFFFSLKKKIRPVTTSRRVTPRSSSAFIWAWRREYRPSDGLISPRANISLAGGDGVVAITSYFVSSVLLSRARTYALRDSARSLVTGC